MDSKDSNVLKEEYLNSKDIRERFKRLKLLVFDLPDDGKDFFLKAFNKERYLDAKLLALRGYAYYSTESEVELLSGKILELLKKREKTTPFNYEEYESMRSALLLPYLVKKYGYDCFKELSSHLEKQYQRMPECFKGIFTLDEMGEYVSLRDNAEVKKSMDDYWNTRR